MKIIVAPDSFKGTISATRAAEIMAAVARDEFGSQAFIVTCPVADGGEGTALVMGAGTGRSQIVVAVDPLGRPLHVEVVTLGDDTVVCDMASCCGLERLNVAERDPLQCTTTGVGVMVEHILNMDRKRLIIGLGGSATVDGGTGFLAQLGAVFTDGRGRSITPYGPGLDNVAAVDLTGLDQRLFALDLIAACDVANPLTGPDGAATVFGPQKGASSEECQVLEQRLTRLGSAYERVSNRPISELPGSGAAGGLGAALAVIGAELRSGIDVVLETIRFDQLLDGADLVVTGEGRFDHQTLSGKALMGISRWCNRAGVPVIAMVGSRDPAVRPEDAGLLGVFDTSVDRLRTLTGASAIADLEDSCRQLFRLIVWATGWRC